MVIRKRKQPTPDFKLPPPYQPMTGERAPLQVQGVFPYCVLMQVASKDDKDDYVLCRGFDCRMNRFIEYEEGNSDKPGIPVAKPYGSRRKGLYKMAGMYAASLPFQSSNASPVLAKIRIGQNPGKSQVSPGHPADLLEEVDELLTDDGKYVNWMFIEQGSATLYWCMLMEAHPGADTCFDIIVGDWDAEFNKWIFTCADTPDIGVDFHYDAPLPEIYACGWFEKHPSDTTDSGWIYHVVSLDCTSRGACADLTATGCGEA